MWDHLGLNDVDEVVYRHDVTTPHADVQEVARTTGLTPEAVAESRGRLAASGLLRMTPTGETSATLSGLNFVTERLRGELDAEYANRRNQLAIFQAEMARLVNEQMFAAGTAPRQGPQVQWVNNPETAAVKLIGLMHNARHEVIQVDPGIHEPTLGEVAGIQAAEMKALGRGVAMRAVYPPEGFAQPSTRRRIQKKISAGAAVRTIPTAPTRLFVFDQTIAVLIDGRVTANSNMLLIQEQALVRMFSCLFDNWWCNGTNASTLLSDSPDEGDESEKIMLRLFGDGLKDEAIAKRLGVSVRTVRRKISDVMQRLPAESRFQAGVQAVRRGWI